MDQHNIWRYFCQTEGNNIFEYRELEQGPPTLCTNDPNHNIDQNSITLIKQGDKHEYKKDNPHMVNPEQIGLGNVPNLKYNLLANTPPSNFNDMSQDYNVGSRWIDIVNSREYVCVNPTAGSAVWKDTTIQGAGSIDNAINVGSEGVGIYKQKNDTTFEFKKLTIGSDKLELTNDIVNDVVRIDLDEGKININNLLGAPNGEVVGDSDEQFLTNKTIIDPRVSPGLKDLNGNDLLILDGVPNATNSIKISNAASTMGPSIKTYGDDNDIDLMVETKGSGRIRLGPLYWPINDGMSQQVLQTDGFGNLGFVNVDTRKQDFLTTINDTPVPITIINTQDDTGCHIEMIVTAKRVDGILEIATFERKVLFLNAAGTLTLEAEDHLDIARQRQWQVNFIIVGNQIRVEVTGEDLKTINWQASYKVIAF